KHPFNENGNRRVTHRLVVQISNVEAGIKLCDIAFPIADFCLSPRIFVSVDLQVNALRLDRSINERLSAIIVAARHHEFQRHANLQVGISIMTLQPESQWLPLSVK